MCVYCNRSQKTSQRVKGNSHATRLHVRLLWSITVHTLPHTRENVIYLFYTIKIEMIYWSILRAWKKTWADVDLTPSVCHHGQQPTKMHTEVTLLYCIIRAIKWFYFISHFLLVAIYQPTWKLHGLSQKQETNKALSKNKVEQWNDCVGLDIRLTEESGAFLPKRRQL